MVSTLDFESSDPSSNLGGTFNFFYIFFSSSFSNVSKITKKIDYEI